MFSGSACHHRQPEWLGAGGEVIWLPWRRPFAHPLTLLAHSTEDSLSAAHPFTLLNLIISLQFLPPGNRLINTHTLCPDPVFSHKLITASDLLTALETFRIHRCNVVGEPGDDSHLTSRIKPLTKGDNWKMGFRPVVIDNVNEKGRAALLNIWWAFPSSPCPCPYRFIFHMRPPFSKQCLWKLQALWWTQGGNGRGR